jgi:hypothetical protein
MTGFDVDAATIARLGEICTAFPDVVEEEAWRGTRWRIRGRTFAHVLPLTHGNPPSYAKAAGIEGPAIVLTFQITAVERDLFTQLGLPYWAVRWGRDVGGLVLGESPDWSEIAELLTDSYCLLAPRKLADQVSISAPE